MGMGASPKNAVFTESANIVENGDIQVVNRSRKRQSASPVTNDEGSDVDSPDEAVEVDDSKVRRVEDTEYDDELAVEQELVDDVVEVKHERVDC